MTGTRFAAFHSFETLEVRRLFAADLLSDAAGLSAAPTVTIDGVSYFFANNGTTGRELWKSDGTGAGTVLVKDLTPGADSTELQSIFNINGHAVLLTVVHHGILSGRLNDDYTLWSSDGTADGTVKLAAFDGTTLLRTRQVGDQLALLVHHRSSGDATVNDGLLYFTDGTAGNTRLVKSFPAASSGGDFVAFHLLAAGDRVVFDNSATGQQLWSSDGTSAETINIGAVMGNVLTGYKVDLSRMDEVPGKMLLPGSDPRDTWITDGTLAGTVQRPIDLDGRLDFGSMTTRAIGGTYFLIDVKTVSGTTIQKTLYALDVQSNTLTALFSPQGDASGNAIDPFIIGSRVFFTYTNSDTQVKALWTTDGTAHGTVKLAEFGGLELGFEPVDVAGTAYFIVTSAPYVEDADPHTTGAIGWIGASNDYRIVNSPGLSKIELWRSDGTPETTGAVATLWQGDANGLKVAADLTEAHGKLLVQVVIKSGVTPDAPSANSATTLVSDETTAYDSHELSFGRNGATARLVNGILRIGGSVAADNIKLWRSSRNPDKIVIAYNGNERTFPFSDVKKIVVDLQSGNDYVEILEADGGPIRARTSIFGGDGADTIITGAGRDTIFGGAGGDKVRSRGNADEISGGAGRDRINSGAGDDEIAGGSGNDQVVAGEGVDVLFGQTAIEKAFGEDTEGQDLADDILLSA